MRTVRSFRLIAVAMASIATVASGEVVRPTLPPFTDAYEPRGVDERGIWMEADEDERKLRDSNFVINDSALHDYLKTVLCKTVGQDRCSGARIYVMRVAAFNANMAPNGTLQIWSGLLLRVRNEAELAAILGHEFAHFEQRHGLKGYRQQRSALDVVAWASFLRGGAVLQSAAIGSIFSFSRDQEREADLLSSKYIANSGYDPRCFAAVWTRMMDEADATSLGRKQRSTRYDRVAFFSTHPTNLDRAKYLKAEATNMPPGGDTNEAAFNAALKPWRSKFLEDQIKLNDFGGTEYLLGQLAQSGWTEDLLFARAELYRLRGYPRDLVSAAGFYRQAIALDPAHAEAYRGLGTTLVRSGEDDAGRSALQQYLTLRPAAQDASMITSLLAP